MKAESRRRRRGGHTLQRTKLGDFESVPLSAAPVATPCVPQWPHERSPVDCDEPDSSPVLCGREREPQRRFKGLEQTEPVVPRQVIRRRRTSD